MTAYLSILGFVASLTFAVSEGVVFGPDTWAVLVAGSNGWDNYRHQADICHAYHSLIRKGVKKEKIITLMYDDIANNDMNPTKGIIVNKPNGENVYDGVVIDYKGKDVTPQNFLNILEGNESAMKNIGSGKVLKSTKNDTVFINFSDHGGGGALCFPMEDLLYADDFIRTLNKMSETDMFGKLVVFIEACEAGSMFDGYIDHLKNVLVSTASARDESSWAYYCYNKKYQTCLGDLYSIKWMERLDKLKISESLFDNYNAIRTEVNQSHVQLYGDYHVGFLQQYDSDEVEDGYQSVNAVSYEESNHIDSRDVPLYLAKKGLEFAKEPGSIMLKKAKLEKMIHARGFADNLISKILETYTEGNIELQRILESRKFKLNLDLFSCYKELINAFNANCFNIPENTYLLKHIYKLSNICARDMSSKKAVSVIQEVCSNELETISNLGIAIE